MNKTTYQFAFIFITLIFLMACTGNIDLESENKGIQHYKNGEYQKAIPLLEKAEDGGSSSAAFYLGEIFRKGEGVNQDFGRSCTHYINSAKGGNNNAYLLAGSCFVMGKGVKQDFAEALKWFKKASDESEKTDLTESDKKYLTRTLATMYYSGKGTLQDFSEAAKWAEKAAELGDANSQAVMAFLLYTGQGVLADRKAAWIWAQKSADQGNDLGEVLMGVFNQYAESPDMKAAFDWYEKSAKQGNPAAQYQLGTFYEEGIIVPEDIEKAHACYKQAADSKKSDNLIKALMEFEARQKKQK